MLHRDNAVKMLQDMLEKCHLQSIVTDPRQPLDSVIDNGLRWLFPDGQIKSSVHDYFPDIKPKTVYRITDMFMCRYIVFELNSAKDSPIFMTGPYLYNDVTQSSIMEQGEKMGLSPNGAKQLEYFYASLPVIRDENCIFAMINTFAEYFWEDGSFDCVDIALENSAAFMNGVFTEKIRDEDVSLNINAMEKRYEYENRLMDAVSRGNIHKAEQMMSGFSSAAFESRVPDSLRNLKNYCIIMNTLLRKAAENGGVHPIYLDRVSSEFAKTIESFRTVSAVSDFMPDILRQYCRLVKRHSLKNYSSPVQRAIIAVESDLTKDLSLKSLAEQNNVSSAYFSGLFKKETGQTLTEYVNERRIKHAAFLLKTTKLQIQTVAQHTGILDMHYFCRLFKKYMRKTPSEYRKSITFR